MSRGGHSKASVVGLVATVVCAVAILFAPVAQGAPGDVYVSDQTSVIWKLPPSGGEATVLSDDPDLSQPYGMTLGPDGLLYVADSGNGKIFKVDRVTGTTTEVADIGDDPIDVAFDAQGRLLAVKFTGNDIFVINRTTGVASTLHDGTGAMGFNSLGPARNGALYVADEVEDTVYRLVGNTLTPVIENDPQMTGPNGLALSGDEHFLYVGSFADPRFFREDLRTGQTAKFELGVNPYSLSLLPSNRLIFSNANTADIDTVGLTGGTVTDFSTDPDLNGTRDIAVEPKRCAGRFPTVVGTTGADVIKGSRFADVISTLGGKDRIKGLAGADLICAGPGRDRLIGGGGRDRLLGQGGRDRLVGGKGKDVCKGGPGRDVQRAC